MGNLLSVIFAARKIHKFSSFRSFYKINLRKDNFEDNPTDITWAEAYGGTDTEWVKEAERGREKEANFCFNPPMWGMLLAQRAEI